MRPSLLVLDAQTVADERAPITRLGGRPVAPPQFAWPRCGDCGRALQFLGQVRHREELVLLFSCHDVGCGVGGSPNLPSNCAVRVSLDGVVSEPPPDTPTLPLTAVKAVPFDQANRPYDEARFDPGVFVFGMHGGEADSVSGHVPRCDACDAPMVFIVSLEEGSLFNFAGVQAFVFGCASCPAAQLFVDDFF